MTLQCHCDNPLNWFLLSIFKRFRCYFCYHLCIEQPNKSIWELRTKWITWIRMFCTLVRLLVCSPARHPTMIHNKFCFCFSLSRQIATYVIDEWQIIKHLLPRSLHAPCKHGRAVWFVCFLWIIQMKIE